MKKIASLAVLAAVLCLPSLTFAQSASPTAGSIVVKAEGPAVAAGAVVNVAARPTGDVSEITVVCDNHLNAVTTGTLTLSFLHSDCTTVAGTFTVTCANADTNGGYTFVYINPKQSVLTTTGLVQIPIAPPACFSASLAAAGSVARSVTVTGRR
jgi:hypothetical protein